MAHLRYKPDAHHGRYAHIRYPLRREVSREQAEQMLAAMPDPDLFVIEEDE